MYNYICVYIYTGQFIRLVPVDMTDGVLEVDQKLLFEPDDASVSIDTR